MGFIGAFLKQVEEEAAQRLDIKELSKKNLLEKLIVHEAFLDIREKQQEDTQLEQGVLGCFVSGSNSYRSKP